MKELINKGWVTKTTNDTTRWYRQISVPPQLSEIFSRSSPPLKPCWNAPISPFDATAAFSGSPEIREVG
ncbi:MAG: hypothetical protein H6566_06075 [Lewinellaceae bacterium]|nr:hypothetical protein [Lewinellaceae bacterium]